MRIGIACDHGGFGLKEDLKTFLKSMGIDPVDFGSFDETSVDYPDFGIQVAEKVSRGELERGILICGTGIGMSIVANKFPGSGLPWPTNSILPGAAGSIMMPISWCWGVASLDQDWPERSSRYGWKPLSQAGDTRDDLIRLLPLKRRDWRDDPERPH